LNALFKVFSLAHSFYRFSNVIVNIVSGIMITFQVPSLVDKMVANGGYSPRAHTLSGDLMANLIKKPWDPVMNIYSQNKLVNVNTTSMV
jgi:hypothetical protein